MAVPRSWHTLAHLTAKRLVALQGELLRRRAREELAAGSAAFREALDTSGLDPRRVGVMSWTELPLVDREALARDPQRFVLRPSPERVREHWPFTRKLALALGGGRARRGLRRGYLPLVCIESAGRGRPPARVEATAHDLDVIGEVGARLFDVAGVEAGAGVALELPHESVGFWVTRLGAWRADLDAWRAGALTAGLPGEEPETVVATERPVERRVLCADARTVAALLESGARWSTTLLVGAEPPPPRTPRPLRTWGLAEARALFAECAPDSGYHLSPDLAYFEVVDPASGEPVERGEHGELVYTDLAGHGTALWRYRTGDMGRVTWEPCPHCGRTLPRYLAASSGARAKPE